MMMMMICQFICSMNMKGQYVETLPDDNQPIKLMHALVNISHATSWSPVTNVGIGPRSKVEVRSWKVAEL